LINAGISEERKLKLLKLFWSLVGDDRLGLLLAGICFNIALDHFKAGNSGDAALSLAFAVVIGGFAWRDIGKDRAVQL
jgi:hypothetical protein